ncbi:trehalose-6-phosphate synthase [Aspergillus clavatus NRRL 1]|uniref:alpha,alpha-trehalose-phosphate synthase (UDP-forming) n=1 Tax=Aspergillus clavatus (strain ATCC 1007 / CBS 513.65 / DSM 816 / NCTC 3887 / NRRL 1 / QM 1276 / 107) TaxID=344612 RepID=A1CC05_ASPCL|nr:alpha,alpha-trehalose-phosphate synthase subunit, putative [Aspergillus clavatus NRRL 1]EAW13273.1 alpha,alpha-trehalose-phosphate synthase subunit, putative [Aspergillus clavatus NRRL 1]
MVTKDKKRGLIIVSNRLPLSLKKIDDSFESTLSSGGLVTALSGLTNPTTFKWFGWPGINLPDPEEQKKAAESLAEKGVKGVFLDEQLARAHYNGFSNSILWPILHYQSGVDFQEEPWKAYQRVNEIFADTVASEAEDGDLIWVHDYHLMLFPELLRHRLKKQGKNCPIGFTLHTPFPAGDFWRALPVEKDLLSGLLACDVIGFHTEEYKRNFAEACEQSLAQVGVFIVGIDPEKFDSALKDDEVIKRIQELEQQYKDKTVIVGVDRLDYTKGLVQKLQGYDKFLNEHPDLKNKVVLIQVAVPSREDVKEYQELETEISTLVGKICGNHATPEGVPLIYIHRSVAFPELTALYCISKACLITSRREGMNLVASEYVACQEGRWGVLMLSELAGAASFMHHGSVTFHPSSSHELSNAIYQAVTMDEEEKKQRYQSLREFIDTHTSAEWGETFVDTLSRYARSS